MDASSLFTDGSLSFSLTGEGIVVDPDTGEISIPTEQLFSGVGVVVTATGSGGVAPTSFRLDIAADPGEAQAVAPALVTAPSLVGTAEIGSEVSVEPGRWSGEPAPALALQWCRDGAEIAGATAAGYTPEPQDDGTALTCRVIATNTAGSAEATTESKAVRHAAPVASGSLADVTYERGSGPKIVETAPAFTGAALRFAVSGAGATVDPESGAVTLSTDTAIAGETVTVTASNSGGAAELGFRVTVEAAEDPLRPIADDLWLVSPAPTPAEVGQMAAFLDASVDIPTGYAIRVYAGPRAGGISADNHTRVISPGESWNTESFRLAAGTMVYATLWFREEATGVYTLASNEKTFEIPAEAPGQADGLPPSFTLPALVAAPVLSGEGKIGAPVAVDPGKWGDPVPALALQWRRDGTDIPSATAARYTPVAADDLTDLTCAVTASNAAGSVEAVTAALRITHVAPAVVAELLDEIFDEDTGPQAVETADAFAGQALRFAVAGAGATIDETTGLVTIPTGTALSGEAVTVTASNSGGAAEAGFLVTVEAADPSDADPLAPIADGKWSVEPAPRGQITASLDASVQVPAGYTLRVYAGPREGGLGADNHTRQISPGETWNTNTFTLPIGTRVHAMIWYRADDTGAYTLATSEKTFAIQADEVVGPPPSKPGDVLGNPTPSALSVATAFGPTRYGDAQSSSDMSAHTYFAGNHAGIAAVASYNGTMSSADIAKADAHVLANLREAIKPQYSPKIGDGAGSIGECMYGAIACIAKTTPRVWNQLSSAERGKIDTLMKALGFGKAFWFAARNSSRSYRGMEGGDYDSRPTYNSTHRMGKCWGWAFASLYFGQSTWQLMMNGYDHDAFKAELKSMGLTNTYNVWNHSYANSNKSHINDCITNNWRDPWGNQLITSWKTAVTNLMLSAAGKTCRYGANNNNGVSGGCGRTINISGYPTQHLGQVGMFSELDASDANGARASCQYASINYEYHMMMLATMVIYGEWTNETIPSNLITRLTRGCDDLRFKMSIGGHRDYARGSCRMTWPGSSSQQRQYGLGFRFNMWWDVLRPYLAS